MSQGRPFTLADVRDLARDPAWGLAAAGDRPGSGFGYPQRSWLYEAVDAYYSAGRDPLSIVPALDRALARGRGMTPWKAEVRARMRPMLQRFVDMDRRARGVFRRSAFARRPTTSLWQGHALGLPMGLVCEDLRGLFVRLLWMDRSLMSRARGVHLVAAASLVCAEPQLGPVLGIETWHLREGVAQFYATSDLRLSLARLDQLLSAAENRRRRPPAA